MEVPRLGVESELQLLVYTTATATQNRSHICKLHHSSWQPWILNPLSEAREQTHNLMVPGRICFHCATMGTPGSARFGNARPPHWWQMCHILLQAHRLGAHSNPRLCARGTREPVGRGEDAGKATYWPALCRTHPNSGQVAPPLTAQGKCLVGVCSTRLVVLGVGLAGWGQAGWGWGGAGWQAGC